MRKSIIGSATVLALAGAVNLTALLQHPAHAQDVLAGRPSPPMGTSTPNEAAADACPLPA